MLANKRQALKMIWERKVKEAPRDIDTDALVLEAMEEAYELGIAQRDIEKMLESRPYGA